MYQLREVVLLPENPFFYCDVDIQMVLTGKESPAVVTIGIYTIKVRPDESSPHGTEEQWIANAMKYKIDNNIDALQLFVTFRPEGPNTQKEVRCFGWM